MRTVFIFALALALAACGPGAGNNAGNEPAHDHYHSHAGESHALGTVEASDLKFSAWLKGHVERGGTTILEVLVEGIEITPDKLKGEVLGPDGATLTHAAFHAMKEPGRFGAHLAVPKEAPKGVRLRLQAGDGKAEFKLE